MNKAHERDFVGYGANPPDPRWPEGARIAVNFIVNYEEGSEYSVPDGDGRSEATLTDTGQSDMGVGGRDLAAESMFEYGSRVGFWRLHRLFTERGIPLTVSAAALALERNEPAARAIAEAGHEVLCHGWRWVNQFQLSEEEEREHIRRAVESLTRTVGRRPLGWYCRYGPSMATRRLLVEEGGFIYDSNSYADELPYWEEVDGHPHLVIPHTFTNNDNKFARGWWATSNDVYQWMKDAFDVLWREGSRHPKMMSVSLHLRVSGHPARFAGIERFVDYLQQQEGVWLCQRADVARHWIKHFPAPSTDDGSAG
ncbi:MAG: polysaccharide deacetylase family protein [Ectothiorhodospiraceae bacterium]|nr:polysaccharide deacetylase family protein [Ectothiorhodospiraceae bacterium]